jgi:hypothetical protein
MSVDVQQITGNARSVAQLLSNNRFGLEFYQREYSWEETQVAELIDDLSERFLVEHDPAHERRQVASYRPYFLGPVVTAQREGIRYLVDGQQRITTLSLVLIYLRRMLAETSEDEARALDALIYSTSFGEKTFNLDVEEREKCLTAILEGTEFHVSTEQESVRNLWERYGTIEAKFPDELRGAALPYFVDWLQHRVILVEIGAPDQDMALEIFETMNDRGLRLSNTDMLKSFLLARVGNEDDIRELNDRWRRRVTELADVEKNADAEFVKAWLRGNYAETQRERKAKAAPGDFDVIGTAFHKWVRDNAGRIGLEREQDFRRFVENEFLGLSSRYLDLLSASEGLTPGLEPVFYNGRTGFTLQLPVILAALTPDDDDQIFRAKSRAVAGALDIFVARRMVNFRNFGYSTVVYSMFNLMKELRNRPAEQVLEVLLNWLESEAERLDGIRTFRLNQRNRWQVHYLLARMTAWLDEQVGRAGTFPDYVDRTRRHPFEVEHIWANHYDRYIDEFDNQYEFDEHRNRFGDLLLLPKDFNASFGDMDYALKVEHYNAQNTLVRSLHPAAYQNNPSFLRLINEQVLPFRSYPEAFTRSSIEERQELYRHIAELVWDPQRLAEQLNQGQR